MSPLSSTLPQSSPDVQPRAFPDPKISLWEWLLIVWAALCDDLPMIAAGLWRDRREIGRFLLGCFFLVWGMGFAWECYCLLAIGGAK